MEGELLIACDTSKRVGLWLRKEARIRSGTQAPVSWPGLSRPTRIKYVEAIEASGPRSNQVLTAICTPELPAGCAGMVITSALVRL
jgi:hypothetical protein